MGKFKVGDTVRCVSNGTAIHPNAMGYKPDREFVVYYVREDTDGDLYFPKNDHGVYESDLILVETLPKTLPKSFACQNTNQELWGKYINWLNVTYKEEFDGDNYTWPYYGVDIKGLCDHNSKKHFDTILSLEEWDEIVNGTQIKTKETEEVMKKYYISRGQLKEIHDVACSGWKITIELYSRRNPFADMIEFTQEEVDTMFKAATLDQTPVLEGIFGKQTREIDLSGGTVDGKVLFDTNGNLDSALMCVRSSGTYGNKAFILDETYNWDLFRDTNGNLCLVPTRK